MLDWLDKISAGNALEQYAAEVTVEEDERLASIVKDRDHFWNHNKIEKVNNPISWRIMKTGNEDQAFGKEEVVFTIQGIISSKGLPPFIEKSRIATAKYRLLRQGVALTGLGTPTFGNAVAAAKDIYNQFDRYFTEGTLVPWTQTYEGDSDSPCFDMSNRYLTPTPEARGLEAQEFLAGVDPQGILRKMAEGDGITSYVHTEDNQVQYFTTYRDGDGMRKYTPCEPQTFRVGDIVQAQLSFVTVPVKNERRKLLTVLRSLALIDCQFASTSAKSTQKEVKDPATPLASVKRRIGYQHLEEKGSDKREKMDVDAEGQRRGEAVTRSE